MIKIVLVNAKHWMGFAGIRLAVTLCMLLPFLNSYSQIAYSEYVDGKVYVKIKNDVFLNIPHKQGNVNLSDARFIKELISAYNINHLSVPFFIANTEILNRIYQIDFADYTKVDALLEQLKGMDIVDYAERVPLDKLDFTPNDPSYAGSNGWHLTQIRAAQAWDISKGSKSIVVAVVDGAIATTHPDLTSNIWVNSGEIPGNNIDDDANGYIDDINGYDVADGDNDPSPPVTSWSHGTHVAGIMSATTNNSLGIASIGFNLSIMAVKAEVSSGTSTAISHGYSGITYAAKAGANVINCSWGGTGMSSSNQNVINYAVSMGCIVVVSAGNNGNENLQYPSAYNGVVNVASTTTNDAISSFSSYGTTVTISAPGSNIYSTIPSTSYGQMSGTSMASPLVAGLCGLMWSANPTLDRTDIISCLYSSATNIDSKIASKYIGKIGAGRINAEAALQCAAALSGQPPLANFTSDVTTTCSGTVKFQDLSTLAPASWFWDFGDGSSSTLRNPTHTYLAPGTYSVELKVTNSHGADSTIKVSFIIVTTPAAPSVTSASRCGTGTLSLSATGGGSGVLDWYSSSIGGTLLFTGSPYVTPSLSSTTTYYVEEAVKYPVQGAGAANNTFGTGGNFNSTNNTHGLYFDVSAASTLISVVVYENTGGSRTIQLLNSASSVINTTTVTIPVGTSTVPLNFNLTPGTGYFLKFSGTVDCYRNNAGPSYPYTLPGVLSITGSDVANYYYFFYNWKVQKAPCTGPRSTVTASVSTTKPIINQNGNLLSATSGTSYQWYLNGTLISGATNQTWFALASGSYTVEVTGTGCTGTSDPLSVTTVGIDNPNASASIQVYPNPVKNELWVTCSGTLIGEKKVTLELYNPVGEKVYEKEIPTQNSESKTRFDVSSFASGLYVLKLTSGTQQQFVKVVKE